MDCSISNFSVKLLLFNIVEYFDIKFKVYSHINSKVMLKYYFMHFILICYQIDFLLRKSSSLFVQAPPTSKRTSVSIC